MAHAKRNIMNLGYLMNFYLSQFKISTNYYDDCSVIGIFSYIFVLSDSATRAYAFKDFEVLLLLLLFFNYLL